MKRKPIDIDEEKVAARMLRDLKRLSNTSSKLVARLRQEAGDLNGDERAVAALYAAEHTNAAITQACESLRFCQSRIGLPF